MQHAAQRNKKLRIVYRFYHPNNIIIKSVRCLKCLSADVLAVFLLDDAVHCDECTTHQVPQLASAFGHFFSNFNQTHTKPTPKNTNLVCTLHILKAALC